MTPDNEFDLDGDDVETLLSDMTFSFPDDDEPVPLRDVITDLTVGHYEVSAYKRGALTTVERLDEAIEVAQSRDESDRVELLEEVRRVAFGLYDRIESTEEMPEQEPNYE